MSQRGVDRGDDEGQAVGACPWRETGEERVVDLGDAEKIPWQAGNTGACEFNSHPGKRDQNKSGLTAEAPVEGGDQGSKQSVVEAEIEAEEDENSGGDGLGQPTVEVHGLVDPVAVAQVPDEATEVTEKSRLREGKWISCLGVTEKGPEERQKRDPAEGGAPERRGSCNRKGKNLKDA